MDKIIKTSKTVAELLRKAEKKIASQSAVAEAYSSHMDAKRLLHELQMQQV